MKKNGEFIGILLLMLSVIYFGIAANIKYEEQTIADISEEINATILKTQNTGTEEKPHYVIYTREHGNIWHLNSYHTKNLELLDQLQVGDRISFCIKKGQVEYVNEEVPLDLLLLKKNGNLLYSIEDYNKYEKKQMMQDKATGMAVSCAFGVLFLCTTFSKKKKEQR